MPFVSGTSFRSRKRARLEGTSDVVKCADTGRDPRHEARQAIKEPPRNGLDDLSRPIQQGLDSVQASESAYVTHQDQDSRNISGLPSPVPTDTTARSYENYKSKGKDLSRLIYPDHEPAVQYPQTRKQRENTGLEDQLTNMTSMILSVCEALHISTDTYYYL